jgi:hypothetical protein
MSDPSGRQLSPGVMVAAGVLLAIPVLALVIVPIYARKGPEFLGFPFFYWYQLMWVFICAAFTGAAYLLIERDRKRSRR